MSIGFILHPTWYAERGRPVVHLFGRLSTGETFVVRDGRLRPHFYVRARELAAALSIVPLRVSDSDWAAPDGAPLGRIHLDSPLDAAALQARLEEHGIATFEADLPFATRYIVDAGIRGSVGIEGPWQPGRLVARIYQEPVLTPETWVPSPSILSLDIETTPDLQRVLSVALWGENLREVLVLRPGPAGGDRDVPESVDGAAGSVVRIAETERDLLLLLAERIRAQDPDVLAGWNVIDFDLRVLQQRFDAQRVPFHLGRADLPCRILLDRGGWGNSRAIVPGRMVLDGLTLLRGAQERLEDWRLESAARAVLGEGKTLSGEDMAVEIERRYREDLRTFLVYNLTDARLVYEILERRRLVDLAVRQSLLTGLPLDRTRTSIAAFDSLYLAELHRRRVAAPSVVADQPVAPTAGGFVLPARPGIHDWVAVLDYRSLYPSIIRTFRIDPLSLAHDKEPDGAAPADTDEVITAPNGARFRTAGGILPELLDRLFPERERLRATGDRVGSTAVKLLMNSFYGVLATPRCRFYSPETANAITGFGQWILLWTRESIEAGGRTVLYGDTDSIFVALRAGSRSDADQEARELAGGTTRALADHLRATHGVQSRCELQADSVFRRLMLFPLRGGRRGDGAPEGSRKRYAGLVDEAEGSRVVYVGLEQVRRDWTALAKLFQRELVERVFRDEPVDGFVQDFLRSFRAGEFDDLVAYRRARRPPGEAPPASAMFPDGSAEEAGLDRPSRAPGDAADVFMTGRRGRIEQIVMTTAGPEPAAERRHGIDRAHYEEKQLRPIGESVLSLLGLDWEAVTGGQGSLF